MEIATGCSSESDLTASHKPFLVQANRTASVTDNSMRCHLISVLECRELDRYLCGPGLLMTPVTPVCVPPK